MASLFCPYFLRFKLFIHSFIHSSQRQCNREKRRGRENLYLLLTYGPHDRNRQGLSTLKPKAWNLYSICHTSARTQALNAIFHHFSGRLCRDLNWEQNFQDSNPNGILISWPMLSLLHYSVNPQLNSFYYHDYTENNIFTT